MDSGLTNVLRETQHAQDLWGTAWLLLLEVIITAKPFLDIYVQQFSIETLNLSLRATSSITQIVVHNRTMAVTEQEQLPTVGADTSKAATGVHALIGTLCQPVPATMQTQVRRTSE